MCRLHLFVLDSHFATFWESNCPFGFLLVMFPLGSSYFMFVLFLSLWCLWWEVWDNCIDSWSLPSLLFSYSSSVFTLMALNWWIAETELLKLNKTIISSTEDSNHDSYNTPKILRILTDPPKRSALKVTAKNTCKWPYTPNTPPPRPTTTTATQKKPLFPPNPPKIIKFKILPLPPPHTK